MNNFTAMQRIRDLRDAPLTREIVLSIQEDVTAGAIDDPTAVGRLRRGSEEIKVVGDFRFGIYAAPSYLEGREDILLPQHDWCLLQGISSWMVPAIWKKRADADDRTVMTGSSIVSVLELAAAGAGLTLLPSYVGEGDARVVRLGGFVDVLLERRPLFEGGNAP